jgi:hypothetical protein
VRLEAVILHSCVRRAHAIDRRHDTVKSIEMVLCRLRIVPIDEEGGKRRLRGSAKSEEKLPLSPACLHCAVGKNRLLPKCRVSILPRVAIEPGRATVKVPAVFDPLFTTTEVGRGTGRGLAIVRSVIVDRHKGALTFEYELGKGTTFYIRLSLTLGRGPRR